MILVLLRYMIKCIECILHTFKEFMMKIYHFFFRKKNNNDSHYRMKKEKQKQTSFEEKAVGTVKVFILLGQSNMLGMGHIHGLDKDGTLEYAVKKKKLYPYLINTDNDDDDDDNDFNWATSPNVRNVRVMGDPQNMKVYRNEFMSIRGDTIGPEFGIGHHLETYYSTETEQQPVMLLKSCIGNRSLGWDLLPPGSEEYEYNDRIYAGYKESPAFWKKGSDKPDPMNWYAGKQYDTDVANAKSVLSELNKYYPNATKYEIAGFFWWQGDKDCYDEAYAAMYERNLVKLIQQLRLEFNCPNSKFVLATLGQTDIMKKPSKDKGRDYNEKSIIDAMFAVDGTIGYKYPEFVGNVATVYSHPLSKGGSSNGHYNGNAETYMNIGEAMGNSMVELLKLSNAAAADDDDGSCKNTETSSIISNDEERV